MHERTDTLPCLNCEGEAMIVPVIEGAATRCRIMCQDCGRGAKRLYDDEDAAVDAWNGGPSFRLTMAELQRDLWRTRHCVGAVF